MGRPKATPEQERKSLTTLKGPQDWCEWMAGLAEHSGMSLAGMIDQATKDYAKKVGYKEAPPPRRYSVDHKREKGAE